MIMKIEALVREDKLEDVKEALNEIDVNGFTVSQVMGCGVQKGYMEKIRGSDVEAWMNPKIKFEIVVPDREWADRVIEAVRKSAFTGEIGDGKIFLYQVEEVMRIRTGETGYCAIHSCNENEV
ncbi:MAG: P-II family nitrogen regulator [Eubacteriaceae bacterium]|jgi:nitrogen regulatory protein P-II 1